MSYYVLYIHLDYMSSNHLLDASEHDPKSVCIPFKNFPKKIIVTGLEVAEDKMTGLVFTYLLSPCKSLSICTCECKKSLKVSREKKVFSTHNTAHTWASQKKLQLLNYLSPVNI